MDDGTAINLGTMERVTVKEAAKLAMQCFGYTTKIKPLPQMPTGPQNRVCDNALAKKLLGWEPKVPFAEGIKLTAEWYKANRKKPEVEERVAKGLLER